MGFIDMQMRQLDTLRPGSWVPGIKQRHRGTKTYTCTPGLFKNDVAVAVETIHKMLATKDSPTSRVAYTGTDSVTMYFITPVKFLDVLTIKVCSQSEADEQGYVSLAIVSRSTCMVPASVPGAPLFGSILAFFPFRDWGQNKKHIRHVGSILNENGVVSDDQVKRRNEEEQVGPASE
jgi:hypothetical protein